MLANAGETTSTLAKVRWCGFDSHCRTVCGMTGGHSTVSSPLVAASHLGKDQTDGTDI